MITLKKVFYKLRVLFLDIILFNYLILIILIRYLVKIKYLFFRSKHHKPKTNWRNNDLKINNILGIRFLKFLIKQYPLLNSQPIRRKLVDFTYEMF